MLNKIIEGPFVILWVNISTQCSEKKQGWISICSGLLEGNYSARIGDVVYESRKDNN